MTFSELLRQEANPIFQSIRHHPFVLGIEQGELPPECLIHYVQQDVQYLQVYCRIYGMALYKSDNREQMQVFYDHIGSLLHGEPIAHRNFCHVAGVVYEDIWRTSVKLAPTTHDYARHMLSVAQQGTLAAIVAAVLPCHWVYVDIAKQLTDAVVHRDTHPFHEWITFYASDIMQSRLVELTALLDQLAPLVSDLDLDPVKSVFFDSCRLEYQFFDMAYNLVDAHV